MEVNNGSADRANLMNNNIEMYLTAGFCHRMP